MFSFLKKLFKKASPDKIEEKIDPLTASVILMIEVAWADQKITSEEERIISSSLEETFNLEPQQGQRLLETCRNLHEASVGSYEYTRLINQQFSYDEKTQIIEILWKVANADHDISHWEEHTIRRLSDLLYVSHQDFIDAKIKTKKQNH